MLSARDGNAAANFRRIFFKIGFADDYGRPSAEFRGRAAVCLKTRRAFPLDTFRSLFRAFYKNTGRDLRIFSPSFKKNGVSLTPGVFPFHTFSFTLRGDRTKRVRRATRRFSEQFVRAYGDIKRKNRIMQTDFSDFWLQCKFYSIKRSKIFIKCCKKLRYAIE